MKILVTGCKGFVGSVLCRVAQDLGHTVYGLDDESRGLNDVSFLGDRYMAWDCRDGIPRGFCDDAAGVFHFAAATGSLERPIEELREYNVDMAVRVYKDAVKAGAGRIFWPTTSLALNVPDSPYVQSKEEGKVALEKLDERYRILTPLRFFNVAGAYKGLSEFRKKEVHAIPGIVQAYKESKEFVINGDDYDTADGTPSRDFVNVVDVATYLLRVLQHGQDSFALAEDGALWLATGKRITVSDLINTFACSTGNYVKWKMGPRRAYDCGGIYASDGQVEQMRSTLGYVTPSEVSARDEFLALMCGQ